MNYNEIQITIPNYSHTAQLALCIEHIGAALTQLRVNNRVKSMPKFYQDYNNYSILCYAAHIGGTLEDKMADIALGLMAFAKQNEIDITVSEPNTEYTAQSRLLDLTKYIVFIISFMDSDYPNEKAQKHVTAYLKLAISSYMGICRELNIDLPEHIRLKQEWLKTRQYE